MIPIYEQLIQKSKELKLINLERESLLKLGILYNIKKEYEKSLPLLHESMILHEQQNDALYRLETFSHLIETYK